MLLTWTGYRFELLGVFGTEARDAGFHWDSKSKTHWSGREDVAKRFEKFADEKAKEKLTFRQLNIDASQALDANIDIPIPDRINPVTGKKLEYLPFQRGGVAYAAERENTLIADEMGLGKTIQAIGLINYDPRIKKILVIPPASLRINWSRELMRWAVRSLSGGMAEGGKVPDTDIVICNYDIVKNCRRELLKIHWDLKICDESHYLKNPDTVRTRAVLGTEFEGRLTTSPILSDRTLFLTGTPILNRPIELWPTVRYADPEGIGSSQWTFMSKYCKVWEAPWGWDATGAGNLGELQDRLRAKIMIRRLKKDVLKDLPPKRRQILVIPAPKIKAVEEEKKFYESNAQIIEDAMNDAAITQAEGDEESYKFAAMRLKGIKRVAFEQMSRLRHDTAVAKIPFVIEYVENALEQEDKLVLFCHHTDVAKALYEQFKKVSEMMYMATSVPERQRMVDRFQDQSDKRCKLIIGTIGTMGVGWTLTSSSFVVFAELDWRPGIVTQAEDRLHRIGQLECVNVIHLIFDESLDARQVKRLIEKQEMIEEAVG